MRSFQLYLETLASQALPEGGWGYAPGQAAHIEPTCIGALALSLERARYLSQIDKAIAFLRGCAGPDGAYRLDRGREEAVWPTALVLYVQAALGLPDEEWKRTAARLLSYKGHNQDREEDKQIHDIDLKLVGWPWAEGNFSWVEPTAWACLALRRAGLGEHPRVEEGLRLLLNRIFEEGGINYGNRRILGKSTEPMEGPTAIMLLALQQHSNDPRIAASVNYLIRQARAFEDLDHLCWTKIALALHKDVSGVADFLPTLDEQIIKAYEDRQQIPWLRPAPLRVALTALAFAPEQDHPFRLNPATMRKNGSLPTVESGGKKKSLFQRIKARIDNMAVVAIGQLRPLAPQTSVHIASVTDYNADLVGLLTKQYEAFKAKVPLAGKRVVLKPNMVEYHRNKVINTNPLVIAAVIELCQREGAAEVIVAEGPGHCRNVEYLVRASGLGDVLRHYKTTFVDLNHDEPAKMPNLGRLTGLENLYLARTIATADVVISLPKLKTHHWAVATLSLKNLFGTLPGICYGWPKNELHWRGIDNSIVDIALTRTPDLAIVDGIVGMEGDGPLNGTPKQFGAIIMGTDLVAVDATCCRLMKLTPEKIPYLVMASQKKLGLLQTSAIQQIGESIEKLAQPFETVPHFKQMSLASA